VAWQDAVLRRYVNGSLSDYVDTSPRCAGTSGPPPARCVLPFQFRSRIYTTSYEVTRSFGWDLKHDFTLAATLNRAVYEINAPATTDAQTVADFVSQDVPVSDTRVGPSLQYHTYQRRFVRVIDFDTLALQEDYRLGHDIVARVYPSFRGSGRRATSSGSTGPRSTRGPCEMAFSASRSSRRRRSSSRRRAVRRGADRARAPPTRRSSRRRIS